jgi:heat shock protein HspQ
MDNILKTIQLLENPSLEVRKNAEKNILSYESTLESKLADVWEKLSIHQQNIVISYVLEIRRLYIQNNFSEWMIEENEPKKLEKAFSLFSEYIGGFTQKKLHQKLDLIALDFLKKHSDGTPFDLANFLYYEQGIHTESEDLKDKIEYYNLLYVLNHKSGNPISYSILYLLLANRLGFEATGVSYPDHFLCKIFYDDKIFLLDYHNKAQFVDINSLDEFNSMTHKQKRYWLHAESELIIRLTLLRLLHLFENHKYDEDILLILTLISEVQKYRNFSENLNLLTRLKQQSAYFHVGECILHRRLGYRGVIIQVDPKCIADDEWYFSNQIQPFRNQPWYHIFIDGSEDVTYAGEEDLDLDFSKRKINNPMIEKYFTSFQDGRYIRNRTPW